MSQLKKVLKQQGPKVVPILRDRKVEEGERVEGMDTGEKESQVWNKVSFYVGFPSGSGVKNPPVKQET